MASTPFLGSINMFSFSFAPKGYALCNGQTMPINQNQALFALLGTTFGGNGYTTFQLPNLQGKTPIHIGNGHALGETAGTETNTLLVSQLPQHTHTMSNISVTANVSLTANQPSPVNNYFASNSSETQRFDGNADEHMHQQQLQNFNTDNTGGSQPFNNLQPYLVINFCIALVGIFPSRN
jgi:microcystin-dependent protein